MTPPPHDENGVVVPHDHPDIGDPDGVIRRISEKLVITESDGRRRLSSMVFKSSSGLSVDLEALMIADGIVPRDYVTTPIWYGSIRWTAGALRAEAFQVGYDPVKDEPPLPDNPYHGEVWGKFSNSQQRKLAELAAWFVPIDGVEIILQPLV